LVAGRCADRDRAFRRSRRARERDNGKCREHHRHDLDRFVECAVRQHCEHNDSHDRDESDDDDHHDTDDRDVADLVERNRDDHVGRVVNSALWYTARGTGFVAVILLSITFALGIVTTMRWSTQQWPRFVSAALHKNISLLAVVFLVIHIATTTLDSVSPVHLLNAIIPFTGTYRPLAIGLGVVAIDLLAALVVASLLRRRIGLQIWRAVHWTAYACWPLAMLHGFAAGTDAATTWARAVYIACAGLVGISVAWRVGAALVPSTQPAARGVTYKGVSQ
jgi:sulfoxide reductase heme-binding subunit YedZ